MILSFAAVMPSYQQLVLIVNLLVKVLVASYHKFDHTLQGSIIHDCQMHLACGNIHCELAMELLETSSQMLH